MIAEETEEEIELTDIEEFSPAIVNKLVASGYETINDLLDADKKSLLKIHGIGPKTVDIILKVIEDYKEE